MTMRGGWGQNWSSDPFRNWYVMHAAIMCQDRGSGALFPVAGAGETGGGNTGVRPLRVWIAEAHNYVSHFRILRSLGGQRDNIRWRRTRANSVLRERAGTGKNKNRNWRAVWAHPRTVAVWKGVPVPAVWLVSIDTSYIWRWQLRVRSAGVEYIRKWKQLLSEAFEWFTWIISYVKKDYRKVKRKGSKHK